MGDGAIIAGLDGKERQDVAAALWRSWWVDGRGAGILTGFSGLGKTSRIIRPLITRAVQQGRPGVLLETPAGPMDLDKQLNGLLDEQLRDSGATELAAAARQPSFSLALREVLRAGALVVIDDFQRLLNPSSLPIEPLGRNLQRIATRPPDGGCLWLVSNQEIGVSWTAPFHMAVLEPPSDPQDAQHIVLSNIAKGDAEQRFTAERRLEVIRRLGANPRALWLLGNLLRTHPLEELLGPPGDVPAAPADPRLTEEIERELLAKAKDGLSNAEDALLRELTVLQEPAPWELVEAVGKHLGNVRPLTLALRNRYLLEVSNRYQLHPLVREIDGPRLRLDDAAWREAHKSAGQWYARRLRTADQLTIDDPQLAYRLAGARHHLIEAQALDDLRALILGLRDYIERNYGWTARNPTTDSERNSQISLLEFYLAEAGTEPGSKGVHFQFARLLRRRGAPNDPEKALHHAHLASVDEDSAKPWVLWVQLSGECNGFDAAIAAAQIAIQHVSPDKSLISVYHTLSDNLNKAGRVKDAVSALLEGAERVNVKSAERLVGLAMVVAASESSAELQRVRDWAATRQEFKAEKVYGNVLAKQYQGDWQSAAVEARLARQDYPSYVVLLQAETLSWLGAGNPVQAQRALDEFLPGKRSRWTEDLPRDKPNATEWLKAFVALQGGEFPRASEILKLYLGDDTPTTEADIRAELLRQWDYKFPILYDTIPSVAFPILPPIMTGLNANVTRPQFGPPVLPQHQGSPDGFDDGLNAGLDDD